MANRSAVAAWWSTKPVPWSHARPAAVAAAVVTVVVVAAAAMVVAAAATVAVVVAVVVKAAVATVVAVVVAKAVAVATNTDLPMLDKKALRGLFSWGLGRHEFDFHAAL